MAENFFSASDEEVFLPPGRRETLLPLPARETIISFLHLLQHHAEKKLLFVILRFGRVVPPLLRRCSGDDFLAASADAEEMRGGIEEEMYRRLDPSSAKAFLLLATRATSAI